MHVYRHGVMRGDFSTQVGTLRSVYKRGRRQKWKIGVMALKQDCYFVGEFDETPPYITAEVLYTDVIYTLQTFPFTGSRAPRLLFQTDRSLWETWNNHEGFTSLQSLRPQEHNIWDRNRTGGSESSGTVEKVISHGCFCRIKGAHSVTVQPQAK